MASRRVANFLPYRLAVFRRPQKLSVGALSQQFPFLLIDERIPQPFKAPWNSWLQYWLPRLAFLADPDPAGEQFLVHARPAVLALDLGMDGTDVRQQGFVAVAPARPWPG